MTRMQQLRDAYAEHLKRKQEYWESLRKMSRFVKTSLERYLGVENEKVEIQGNSESYVQVGSYINGEFSPHLVDEGDTLKLAVLIILESSENDSDKRKVVIPVDIKKENSIFHLKLYLDGYSKDFRIRNGFEGVDLDHVNKIIIDFLIRDLTGKEPPVAYF